MNMLNEFEYYLHKGVVRNVTGAKPRADFLIRESETSYEGLKKIVNNLGIDDENVNLIMKECYDIIMALIRAKLLLDGYYASGNYAHEAEISYLKKLGFPENEISFMNELRYFRNSAMYYGKILDKGYVEKVYAFSEKIVSKLKEGF